jgi:hypothetical protein
MKTAGCQTDESRTSARIVESNQRNLIAGLAESERILDVREVGLALRQNL